MGIPGHKYGIEQDPHKVQAVGHAERQQNKDEIESFLDINHSDEQFIPYLAAVTVNLEELARDINMFVWSEAHETEIQNLKRVFNDGCLLRNYDTNALTIFCLFDAHNTSLSAFLIEVAAIDATRTVILVSHTITDTEKNYSSLFW